MTLRLLLLFSVIIPSLTHRSSTCHDLTLVESLDLLKDRARLLESARSSNVSVRLDTSRIIQSALLRVSGKCSRERHRTKERQTKEADAACAWCSSLADGTYADWLSSPPFRSYFSCRSRRISGLFFCAEGHVFVNTSQSCSQEEGKGLSRHRSLREHPAHRRLAGASSSHTYSVRSKELDALLAFKARVLDPFDALASWTIPRNYTVNSSSTPASLTNYSIVPFFCNWFGITCSLSSHRITAISLSLLDLSGSDLNPDSIPPEWENLKELASLDLSSNAGLLGTSGLTGSFPPALLKLPLLQDLNLASNAFSGPLPANLGDMKALTSLKLANNHFSGQLPVSVGQLSKLDTLDIESNELSGTLPDSLGNLTLMSLLYVSSNSLSGSLPPSLINCSSLVTLNVSNNGMEGPMPSILADMPALGVADISSNQFSGLLPQRYSGSIVGLVLKNNRFEGPIPPALFLQVSLLFLLDLSGNSFNGSIPDEISQATILYSLDMSHNQLQGVIPASIGTSLTTLIILNLAGNQLTGRIPPGLATIPTLTQLNLEGNRLSGPLPLFDCARSGQSLQVLALSDNQLSGPLPSTLSSCSSLSVLSVGNNSLSGPVHPFLLELSSLSTLRLSDNLFTGGIPKAFKCNSGLLEINLSGNQLQGPIPLALLACPSLSSLDLSRNSLLGSVSSSSQPSPMFTHLRQSSPSTLLASLLTALSANNLTTSSSSASYVAALTGLPLTYINVSSNLLDGMLPNSIATFQNLQTIDLSNNLLHGNIPSSIVSLRFLQTLLMGSNRLSGPLPANLSSLISLTSFDLSNNSLSGTLPAEIGQMGRLLSLDLSSNNLSGSLAPLSNLQKLTAFNVSSNHFSGPIPSGAPFANFPPSAVANNSLLCGGYGYKACSGPSISTGAIIAISMVGGLALVAFAALGWVLWRRYKRRMMKATSCMLVFERLGFPLKFDDIAAATGDFDDNHMIGKGGFGCVYSAVLKDGRTVAVKRLDAKSAQGTAEFEAEMRVLGNIRHKNLVKLIAAYQGVPPVSERLLIYEFLPGGSLDQLFGSNMQEDSPLRRWKTRWSIALDTARGLKYLHHDLEFYIVHRDMKPSNVLLDENFCARVSDFGLAKEQSDSSRSYVRDTRVVGTVGYLAPEYMRMGRLTTKSDVFAYGVLLLQLVSGKVLNEGAIKHRGINNWAASRPVGQVLDPRMDGDKEDVGRGIGMMKIGLLCTARIAADRPSMADVVGMLENLQGASPTGDKAKENEQENVESTRVPSRLFSFA